jgi:hypothetical protein
MSPGPNSGGTHDLSFLSPRKSGTNVNGLTFSALNKKRCKVEDKGSPRAGAGAGAGTAPNSHNPPKPQGKSDSSDDRVAAHSVVSSFQDRDNPSISMILESSAQRKSINISQLKKFFKKYGQYPAEHRTLIWRILLRLPENEKSFAGLTRRGLHDNYESLYDQYPIRERRVFKRLQGLCSQLAHWNPVFGDVDYLPQMVGSIDTLFVSSLQSQSRH